MGTAAQRFSVWASASRTFSDITELIPVVQREVDILFAFILQSMNACSTSSCMPAEIMVECSYVLAVKASPSDVEMARLVGILYGGESASALGCLCDVAGTLYGLICET